MNYPIRFLYGCGHKDRGIKSSIIFERGLELPIILCQECFGICEICQKQSKTRKFLGKRFCDNCFFESK